MAQREDFGITLVAGRDQPSQPADDQMTDRRDQAHGSRPYRLIEQLETPGETRRRWIPGTYRPVAARIPKLSEVTRAERSRAHPQLSWFAFACGRGGLIPGAII